MLDEGPVIVDGLWQEMVVGREGLRVLELGGVLAGWASCHCAWLVIPALNTPHNFGGLKLTVKDLERLFRSLHDVNL